MNKSNQIKLMSIAGARPNFMKLASIARAVQAHNEKTNQTNNTHEPAIKHIIVHTGQHYDQKMSDSFFKDLGIPEPDINLEVGSASHAQQTAEIMKRFEPVLLEENPDVLLVVGDVNSTIASTLVASKIEYPSTWHRKRPILVHVEAGLRSFDRDMPEEINRILTDALSDHLFVTEQNGIDNLVKEGVSAEKIHFVGNVMIDTLISHLKKARKSKIRDTLLIDDRYGIVTLHRPSNVDRPETLQPLIKCLNEISRDIPLYFPIHPRTLNKVREAGMESLFNWTIFDKSNKQTNSAKPTNQLILLPPLGYLDFLNLVEKAHIVITDSGGIQEETSYLKVPCVTLRENTERPVTVTEGSNYLIGTDQKKILETVNQILSGKGKTSQIPKYWDGNAGERIITKLVAIASS